MAHDVIENLATLIKDGRNAEVQVALQNVDPRWPDDSKKVELLQIAVESGNGTMVRYLLENYQIDSTKTNRTSKHECKNDNEEVTSKIVNIDSANSPVLHSKSVEYYVNSRMTENEESALHVAFKLHDLKCAMILLEHNADVNAMSSSKITPLSYYMRFDDSDLELEVLQITFERSTTLTTSDFTGHMQIASLLSNGKRKALQTLFRSNVDLTAKDRIGRNSLHYLAMNSVVCDWKDIINLLRVKNVDGDAIDFYERNALFYAAKFGLRDLLRFLLDRNADVFIRDYTGFTPLYALCKSSVGRSTKYECAELFLQHGIDPQANHRKTIFEYILEEGDFKLTKLILTHLVFNEVRGVPITDLIREQINSHRWLSNQYNLSKLQMNSLKKIQIPEFTTLFKFLCESNEKKVLYLRNEKFYSSLESLRGKFGNKSEFFNICWGLMSESLEKVQMRKNATEFLCEIMGFSYYAHRVILDKILQYLTDKDFEFYKNRMIV